MSLEDELDVNAPDFTQPQNQEPAGASADSAIAPEQPEIDAENKTHSDRSKKIIAGAVAVALLGFMAWLYTRTNAPAPVNPPHFKPALIK